MTQTLYTCKFCGKDIYHRTCTLFIFALLSAFQP